MRSIGLERADVCGGHERDVRDDTRLRLAFDLDALQDVLPATQDARYAMQATENVVHDILRSLHRIVHRVPFPRHARRPILHGLHFIMQSLPFIMQALLNPGRAVPSTAHTLQWVRQCQHGTVYGVHDTSNAELSPVVFVGDEATPQAAHATDR
jgi:hypothetical protein